MKPPTGHQQVLLMIQSHLKPHLESSHISILLWSNCIKHQRPAPETGPEKGPSGPEAPAALEKDGANDAEQHLHLG